MKEYSRKFETTSCRNAIPEISSKAEGSKQQRCKGRPGRDTCVPVTLRRRGRLSIHPCNNIT